MKLETQIKTTEIKKEKYFVLLQSQNIQASLITVIKPF